MTSGVLACVWANGSSLSPRRIASLCRANDLELVFVVSKGAVNCKTLRLLDRIANVVSRDCVDLNELVMRLRRNRVSGIVTFSDSELELTSRLAERLNLPYNSESAVRALTNKTMQRQALAAAGLPVPRNTHISRTLRNRDLTAVLEEIESEFDSPVAMKPVRAAGSRNAMLAESMTELLIAISATLPAEGELIEEMLRVRQTGSPWGDYIGIDCFVKNGCITSVFLTGKFALAQPFRERGGFGAAQRITIEEQRQVCRVAESAFKAVGVTHGIVGAELKLTSDGPRIIEVNGRLGGPVDRLANTSECSDPGDIAIRGAMNMPSPSLALRQDGPDAFEYILHAPKQASSVRSAKSFDQLREIFGVRRLEVYKDVGDSLDWRLGARDILAALSGHVPTLDHLKDAVESINSVRCFGYNF